MHFFKSIYVEMLTSRSATEGARGEAECRACKVQAAEEFLDLLCDLRAVKSPLPYTTEVTMRPGCGEMPGIRKHHRQAKPPF